VRSNSTDDIACWFIDTDYNEETFIVRHAHFIGADQPYEKLQRALRAEINESAWSALYSTTSCPFDLRPLDILEHLFYHYPVASSFIGLPCRVARRWRSRSTLWAGHSAPLRRLRRTLSRCSYGIPVGHESPEIFAPLQPKITTAAYSILGTNIKRIILPLHILLIMKKPSMRMGFQEEYSFLFRF
jgi:hypothetical protein